MVLINCFFYHFDMTEERLRSFTFKKPVSIKDDTHGVPSSLRRSATTANHLNLQTEPSFETCPGNGHNTPNTTFTNHLLVLQYISVIASDIIESEWDWSKGYFYLYE